MKFKAAITSTAGVVVLQRKPSFLAARAVLVSRTSSSAYLNFCLGFFCVLQVWCKTC